MERRLGYCGDDCAECPRYQATQSGDEGALARVAALWRQAGLRDEIVPAAQIRCTGCSPDKDCFYGIAACAGARKVEHCGRCPDFPCEIISRCLEKSDALMRQARERCSPEDYRRLARAFFRKRENLGC
jgi:Protein of unknown function (DUF3795)